MEPVTILFACRHNAGRSQIAAALARAKAGPHITVLSAGTEPADALHPTTAAVLEERGLRAAQAPRLLEPADVAACDWVITMGCGETCPVFPGVHYEDWPVADPAGQPLERVREIFSDIEARVDDLCDRVTSQDKGKD